ncbi:PepSY-associated TM helix domain-containing protein [Sutcliffiella horikoshii]|uniref:PepSY-associated TM helix domain-containing protein n=1 Tax=Sutcliffiella horikoshii TaxID=79883 RepID=UPI001F3D4C81|nr:PepSY domain-containing protein [Sutcliffiella horikoshii]MCG1023276.1 PepSY domain-containing protein [Sutcliffiella horikoshii]
MEKKTKQEKEKNQTRNGLYQTMWRWHFYAGIIFAPFLIILAFSGAVYLFKPQIESYIYQDLHYVEETQGTRLSVNAQAEKVREAYPGVSISGVSIFDQEERTTKFSTMLDGKPVSVFVDAYSGQVMGDLPVEKELMTIFKKLHSELIVGGTVANRFVELAACWAIILILTGLYIWWPRNRASIWGTVLPRLRSKGRVFWRDMHAVPAFWLSLGLLVLILTGLPWSGVMGEQINRVATATNTGYPAFSFSFGPKPESVTVTKDVAENVPWAAENVPVPSSVNNQYVPLTLNDAAGIAEMKGIQKPYTISSPQGESGVFTIATSHSRPFDNATLHVDQYSGAVLTDVRYADYGVMGKAITLGIALHEGKLFGLTNQLLGLILCIGLIGMMVSSFVMWRKRKPENGLGAPGRNVDIKTKRAVTIIMLLLGLIMPLVGISIIVVLLLDKLVFVRIKRLKAWLG